jgi:predicted permease
VKVNEAAVFKWVVIVAVAAATVIVLTRLAGLVVGALWALLLVIVGCVYGFRWSRERWRQLGEKK